MDNKLTAVVSFGIGAVSGGAAVMIFLKKKYQALLNEAVKKARETAMTEAPKEKAVEMQEPEPEQQQQETEIHAIKNEPTSLQNDLQKKAAMVAREKPNIVDYSKKIRELGYKPEAEVEDYISDYPYLITPDMTPFGEKEDKNGNPYDKITLFYYEDGVIADSTDEIIDDVDATIGNESLSHFGDFPEKDSVFVRNDKLRADFEICMSNLSWEEDVLEMKPYLRMQP